ncbi:MULTISPECIES: FliH/SctL family protein [unclassified Devosia]|uniref:FliH/SctL family protein n=1 Tax=unclassified Devosia TaxID=196773 RepID=UPI001554711A|nr:MULTISPECIES: FliH/SctL family protein [unclassified Devosia]
MASHARFTFDLDLGKRPSAAAVSPRAGMAEDLVARLVAEAREEGYAEGFAAGAQNAAAMAAQTIAAAAATLATRSAEMAAALDDATANSRREAVELAASIGRKLALQLLAREPTAELEGLIAECMANLEGVPHLVIRCHPDIADGVRDIATAHMTTSGFNGRLIVMGDPEQRLGDGRLEWVDGGLVRDLDSISTDIDRRIAAYLEGGHPQISHEEPHS